MAGANDEAYVLHLGQARRIEGLDAKDLRQLLAQVDGHRSVGEIVQALSERFQEEDVLQVLRALVGRILHAAACQGQPPPLAAELRELPRLFAQEPRRRCRQSHIRRVTVVGGGSAGFLAALALARKLPGLQITVVESKKIPIIGVGEATTPLLPAFLHGTLGLDMGEFHRIVRPTWKLGIQFLWGKPAPHYFNYPFTAGRLGESSAYEGDINSYSLPSLLMNADRSHLLDLAGGDHTFLPTPFAYHVDNHRFVSYLRQEAAKRGIRCLDRQVVDVLLEESDDPDGVRVSALATAEGDRLESDLWVDATGFRSILLGKALGSPFESFADSLFTDAALAANRPHGGHLKPHTTAETFDHGWFWTVPQRDSNHCGYVFSTAHTSPDEAVVEMRRRYPDLEDPRLIRFRCGRRQHLWKGNVVALGNAYGFVEPLESTALHMIIEALVLVIRHFPESAKEGRSRALLNQRLAEHWDQLRGFLALHFKFNHRLDTPFWQDCRRSVELGAAAETLELYRERGLLSDRHHLARFDSLWRDFGRDVVLLGQGIEPPKNHPSRDLRLMDEATWRNLLTRSQALVAAALPQEQALELLDRDPRLLHQLQARAPWLQDAVVGGRENW
ncbi:MAG: tryptophan 7-halogenase [Deltaproteobacteria bacterium]|nr:tryptophan 7-halogenase [Deltaproteobacteria bacterium]